MLLVDDHAEIGGQLVHRGGAIEGGDGATGRRASCAPSKPPAGACMTRTTAYGVYDHNLVCAWERRAAGARRALAHPPATDRRRRRRDRAAAVVPDNDRPGVMSADAALVYLRRYGVLVGERVVVATNNDSAYAVAEALAEAGAAVEIRRYARHWTARLK